MGDRRRAMAMAALALAGAGCDQVPERPSRQSVTIKLDPPRPYRPEPGFTLASDVPDRGVGAAKRETAPRS
jgi:hypothetical protein